MKRKKVNIAQYGMLAPNVQRGGQAIPMGNNLYLMKGRQHSAGGIDIGKDLEVENNEVMQMLPNETRVFSSMPMLGGYSPAQLVANGNNPDLVFNAQERWKKENRVRDDGSTYKGGGIHIDPANKGKFTAQAKQHGMGVQPFANKVLAHKENYSPTTVKRATFAKYIGGRKPLGGTQKYKRYKQKGVTKILEGNAVDGSRNIKYHSDTKNWTWGKNNVVLPEGHRVKMSDGYEYQLEANGSMTRIGKKPNTVQKMLTSVTQYTPNNNILSAIGHILESPFIDDKYYNGILPLNNTTLYKDAPIYAFRTGDMSNLKNDDTTISTIDRRNNPLLPRKLLNFYNREKIYLPNSYKDDINYMISGIGLNQENIDPSYAYGENATPVLDARNHNMQVRQIDGKYVIDFSDVFDTNMGLMDNNANPIIFSQYGVPLEFTDDNNLINESFVNEVRRGIDRQKTKKYGGKAMNKRSLINSNTLGSIVRMDGNGIDKLAYIPFTGNRPKTLKAGGRSKARFGIFAHDNLFNIEYLTNPYMTYNANNTKNNSSTDNDIFKERIKYVEPYFKGQSDIPGYINAGVNALGSIANSLIANNAINKQRPPVEPMPLIAPKLKTNFNINADLDINREKAKKEIDKVKRNTASSYVGRNLYRQILSEKSLADSKLYTDKENAETALLNAYRTQIAEIANKNIEMGNAYRQARADFYNNKALAKSQNLAQMFNGVSQAIGMGLNNIGATNTKKLNALIAMLPAIETFMKNKQS